MDVRLWSRDLITDFINLYKSYPCLWKIKSEAYKNRNLRDEAYNKMTEFCRLRGFPNANRDFVVKKIQSLRGSFRKELKKAVDTQRSGRGADEIYIPSLWYYDLLLFTKDQETPTLSISNLDANLDLIEQDDQNMENEELLSNPQSEGDNSKKDTSVSSIIFYFLVQIVCNMLFQ